MKRKYIIGIILASLLVMMVGCGGTSQNQNEISNEVKTEAATNEVKTEAVTNDPVDLELVDSHYTIDNGYVHYTVAIKNPNDGYMPDFAHIKVTGKKSDGSIDFSDDWVISSLAPGSTTYWANQAGDGNTVEGDTIDITVSVDKDSWRPSEPKPADLYKFDNTTVSPKDYGGVKATGEITLTDENVEYGINGVTGPMIVCVFKDANGKLVGGFSGYVDSDLVEGTPSVFDISSFHEIDDYETYELYANPWM